MYAQTGGEYGRWGSRLKGKGSDLVVRFFFIYIFGYSPKFYRWISAEKLFTWHWTQLECNFVGYNPRQNNEIPCRLFTHSFVTPGTLRGKQKQHPTATIVYAQLDEDDDGLPWPFSVNTNTTNGVHPSHSCDFPSPTATAVSLRGLISPLHMCEGDIWVSDQTTCSCQTKSP